jgi:hypothetical protein
MSESLYLTTMLLGLGTVVLIFGMRYYAATQQAKVRRAMDEADRQLAAKSAAAQAETARALAAIQAAVADIQLRLAAVEKLLKAVE